MDLPRPKVDFQSGFIIMTIVLMTVLFQLGAIWKRNGYVQFYIASRKVKRRSMLYILFGLGAL